MIQRADPDAVWVDVNTGAWTLVSLPSGTLAIFTTESVLGGEIPQSLVNHWALGAIRTHLRELAVRAPTMPSHYTLGHDVVYAPDGHPLPPGLSEAHPVAASEQVPHPLP